MSVFGWSYPAGCSGPPDQDGPEACPVCGGKNHDEETDAPVYPESPVFCSAACVEKHTVYAREEARAEAEMAVFMAEAALEDAGPLPEIDPSPAAESPPSDATRVYLSPGRTTFPPCTRVGEEPWETVRKKGLVVCPDDKGAWMATLRPEGDEYFLDFYGQRKVPARPYIEVHEAQAYGRRLEAEVKAAEAKLNAFHTEMIFEGVRFPADTLGPPPEAPSPGACPPCSASSTPQDGDVHD